jgi:uncharacterized protein YdaU (DUF1376 family)
MSKLPSLPLWVDEWTASTRHLDYEQRGVFLSLLILMWERPHCRIPNDDKWLSRRLGMSDAKVKKVARPIIADLCKSSGNWITQERLRKEYDYVRQKVEMNRASAKRRWDKEKSVSDRTATADATADADAMLLTLTPTLTLTPRKKEREALSQRSDAKSIDPSSETLPDNWRPSSADRDYARSRRGWDDNQIDLVAEKFVLHFHAKLPAAKVPDQWRKWVLNERDDPQDEKPRVIV